MNVIPIAPGPAPAPLACAASGSESSEVALADTFAALVGALTAELAADGGTDEAAADGHPGDAAADGDSEEEPVLAMDVPALLAAGPQPVPTRPDPSPDASGEAPVDAGPPAAVIDGSCAGSAPEQPATPDIAGVAQPGSSPQSPPPGPDEPPTGADGGAPVADAPRPVDEVTAEPHVPSDDSPPMSGHGDPPAAVDAPLAGLDASTGGDGAPASPVPAGSPRVAPAAAPAAAAPAEVDVQAPSPSLPDQLVEVIRPIRHAPDGTHRISVQLRPDELGEVLVDVRVRGNEVSLNIRADLAGTADLLRNAVSELRAELDAAGFRSADVDVRSHADPGSAHDRRPAPRAADRTGAPDDPTRPPNDNGIGASPTAAATSGLDVRI